MTRGGRMYLSVEITTFNRKEILRLVLQRMSLQTLPVEEFEVVVSDDGSTDGTIEMVRDFAATAPYPLALLARNHQGCGMTHNRGIEICRGEIILMIADDILPTPHLLAEHAAAHRLHPQAEIGVVGGLVQSPDLPPTPFQQYWDRLLNKLFPKEQGEVDHRNFWVNNLSFKKAFMLKHGMFKDWPPASHEDVELGYRLEKNGMRLLFKPQALAYHHHPETIDSISRRAYTQGYNWHHFESHVPEPWVRHKAGHFTREDDLTVRLRFHCRQTLRALLFNRLTVPSLAVPLVRRASLAPGPLSLFIPLCVGKIASHYFHKGLREFRLGRPYRFP